MDGGTLASSSYDGTIRFWNPVTGIPLRTITGHSREVIRHVMYASHGRVLASWGSRMVQLREPHTGRLIKTVNTDLKWATCIAYSPDNVTFGCGTSEGNVWLVDVDTGEHNETTVIGHTDRVSSVDFSRDGSVLASGSSDKTICLWDVSTGDLRKTLSGHIDRVQQVAFSPAGFILASASDDGTIRLWDIDTGDVIKTLDVSADRVRHIAFSPTGLMLASTGDDGTIQLWNINTSEPLKTIIPASETFFTAYSPDGNTLASTDRKDIYLWNVHTGELLRTFTGHKGFVYSIAYAPDGRTLTQSQ